MVKRVHWNIIGWVLLLVGKTIYLPSSDSNQSTKSCGGFISVVFLVSNSIFQFTSGENSNVYSHQVRQHVRWEVHR